MEEPTEPPNEALPVQPLEYWHKSRAKQPVEPDTKQRGEFDAGCGCMLAILLLLGIVSTLFLVIAAWI